MPDTKVFGPNEDKLEPKLRVIANGDSEVNQRRAAQSGSLAVKAGRARARNLRALPSNLELAGKFQETRKTPKVTHQKKLASDIEARVFVFHRDEPAAQTSGIPGEKARISNVSIAQVSLDRLPALAKSDDVTHIELGQSISRPRPVIHSGSVSAPAVSMRKFGSVAKHKDGANVLIGIVDVQGFDFAHPDFLDAGGKTRFVSIWDQGGSVRPAPEPA